jgi:phospholipid/cholesterol/gamma-HCH transport system substrate-binding protein
MGAAVFKSRGFMSARTHHFRIGLFVVVGALLLVGALFAVGLRSYFGRKDVYETCVTGKVENLSEGALVMLRGVAVGKVSSIEFAGKEYPGFGNQYVVIQFEVPKNTVWSEEPGDVQKRLDAEIADGLRARVQGQGFLGAGIVALEYVNPKMYPVEPVPWKPGHYYIPSAPSQFNRLMTSLEISLRHAEDLDLTALLTRAGVVVDTFNRLAENIDKVDFKQIGANANSLIVELRETNRGLQRTLDGAQQTLSNAQDAIHGADLPGISRDTAALEAKISGAAVDLRRTLASLDTRELDESLANVRAATDELIVLLQKLQQQPSSVLFSKPPKPVTELETPPKK